MSLAWHQQITSRAVLATVSFQLQVRRYASSIHLALCKKLHSINIDSLRASVERNGMIK